MTISDSTTEDLKASAMRALEALEGDTLDDSRAWPVDIRPLANPMTVIYYATDGKAYERTITPWMEGDSLNVALGARREVAGRTLWVPVEGDVGPAFTFSAGKSTLWQGLIFRAGDYPDKGCRFAEDDLEQLVANFPATGVPVMSEHEDSLLGRAMERHGARLMRIWRVGGELHGEIKSPSWLDEALDGMRKSVSVGIDFVAKTLREISLTFAPRVHDAAVFRRRAVVAFSHSTQFQDFAANHPGEAAQIVTEASAPNPATLMDKNTILQRAKQVLFRLPPEKRAEVATDDELNAAFNIIPATPDYTPDPGLVARLERVEKTSGENLKFAREKQDNDDALSFYADQVEAGKVAPADRELVVAAFTNARFKDRHTLATFSINADGSAERALIEQYAKKPVLFRLGGPSLDSRAQPKFTEGMGIFSGDFKEDK